MLSTSCNRKATSMRCSATIAWNSPERSFPNGLSTEVNFRHTASILKNRSLWNSFPCSRNWTIPRCFICNYLRTAVARDVRLNPFPPVTTLLKDEGWQGVAPELKALMATTEDASLPRNAELFEQLAETAAEETDTADSEVTVAVLDDLSELLIDALVRADTKSTVPEWQRRQLDRLSILMSLVRGLLLAKLDGPLARLLNHIGEQLKSYPLLELQIESLLALEPWLAGMERFVRNR